MVFEPQFSLYAPVAAALVYFVLGWLWYGPIFGKLWARHMKMDMGAKPGAGAMTKSMANNLVGNLLLAFVIAHIMAAFAAAELASGGGTVTAAQINGALDGLPMAKALEGAWWMWLGFFLPFQAGRAAWEGQSWALVAINAAYNAVGLVAMVLVIWALA